MDARAAARLYGAGRAALGAAMIAAPAPLGRPWIGPAADGPGTVPLRALGARDLVIGAIAVHVAGHPEVAARWMRACALVDAVDLAATLAQRRRLPAMSLGVAAMAAAGAATGLALSRSLAR
jgi:hypothetical protein